MQSEESEELSAEQRQLRIDVGRFWADPAMKAVMRMVRGEIRKESEESEPADRELREHCYYELHALVRIERRLRAYADGATVDRMRNDRGGRNSAL